MKQHYRVSSVFRDAKGKELRRADTFNDVADGPKQALVEAHGSMETFCAADPRIDSIASTCKGADSSQVSTTDYADELGCGTSSSGLMREVTPRDLDTTGPSIERQAVDAIMNDRMKAKAIAEGKAKEVDAPSSRSFPVNTGGEQGASGAGNADPAGHAVAGGPNAGAGGNQASGAGAVPHGQPRVSKNGCPYLGKDIVGDLVRAKEETDRALPSDRACKAYHVGRSAYDALVKEMEKQNRGMKVAGPISIAGIPVILHDDPNMPPIQVQTGKRNDDVDPRYYGAPAWLTPPEHVYPHKCKWTFDVKMTPEAEAARKKFSDMIYDHSHRAYRRAILGQWPENTGDDNE